MPDIGEQEARLLLGVLTAYVHALDALGFEVVVRQESEPPFKMGQKATIVEIHKKFVREDVK
jgi:hypothetical protein